MTAEQLQAAMDRGAWVSPPREALPVQPMGAAIADTMEACALALARRHRLIDGEGQLHCWNCGGPCGWHISLHCVLCQAEERRTRPERRRRELERQRLERQRERDEEQKSRPVQRVANRSFRDE